MPHLPHPQYGNMGAMAVTLAQTLGQNLGMMWNKHRSSAGIRPPEAPVWPTPSSSGTRRVSVGGVVLGLPHIRLAHPSGDCKCPDIWLGCIMEDTG